MMAQGIQKKDLIDPNNTRRYYYNYKWQVLCEYNGSDEFQQWYAYGNYIDEVLAMGTGIFASTARFYIHDHLYSPAALTDFSGNVLERYEYDAYGNVQILSASYETRETTNYNNPYYFTGRELDFLDNGSLKIMYYRNRFYETYTGRFTAHDPRGIAPNVQNDNIFNPSIQYSDGLSLYEYVSSRPTIGLDPKGLLGAMPDHIDSPGFGPIAPDTVTLTPPDCPFGGCPSNWLDPLPSSGGWFDDWHEGRAIAFYLLGGPWPISIPLGGSSTPDIPLGLLRPDEVEFSHESTFASRVAKAKGFYEWSATGAVRDTIRFRAERYAQRLGPCECTSFGYSHSGTKYGWLIDEDDLSVLIHLCRGPDDDYCDLHYTVRCCVKKACDDGKFIGERVCRVRFDMKDKYSIDAWPEVSWIGRPFWHIIHFDKTLNETFPLDSP